MFKKLSTISFPKYQSNLLINMMPIVFGDKESIPQYLHGYLPIIDECNLEKGKLAYLTIHESFVKANISQRRQGIHTEGTKDFGWGGGDWGGTKFGIYMTNNDGSCNIWNTLTDDVNGQGQLLNKPIGESQIMEANHLYWLTDRTPHEALQVKTDTKRQFFRLVSNETSVWWKQHSTPNPLGIQPDCKILTHSKF